MAKKATTDSFEKNLADLEKLVEQLEQGELSLDNALQYFERGVALAKACEKTLREAEQKVQILTRQSATAEPEPFALDDDGDDN
ncbi:MAG: exodeoxyribonuclease VII small subunit [Gammaproteobacteria bacterium]|nr:exodeoxyribonuclease VII small subunit [Gammaproteobacteria bacterium]